MGTRLTIVPHFREGQRPVPIGSMADSDTNLLIRCFTGDGEPAEYERHRAQLVLDDLARKSAWLMCACTGATDGPILYPQRNRNGTTRMLVRNYDRREHDAQCPFHRLRSERTAPAPAEPMERHNGAFGLIKEIAVGEKDAAEREARGHAGERVPMLRRLLFRVLETAHLHKIQSTGPAPLKDQYEAFNTALGELHFDGGRTIALKNYAFTSIERIDWLKERLERKKPWPKPLEPQGFLMGAVSQIEDHSLVTSKGFTLPVSGKIARFGEDGTAGPYLVMALVGWDRDAQDWRALRAYAHPLHSSALLIPVDSNLERKTLKLLIKLQEWLLDKKSVRIIIEKPLADMPTGSRSPAVRPDFLLRVGMKTVVVETMGYDDPEYLASKARTHPLMERIGSIVEHRSGQEDNEFFSSAAKAVFAATRA